MAVDPKAGRLTQEEIEEMEARYPFFIYDPIFSDEEKRAMESLAVPSEEEIAAILKKHGLG